ncbi:ribosome hibernation-promoting factor, HPF/YfiA family [Aminipila sp.]|jgi:putative sigma-54 modulation protein|uniref:ribosome hibernation-promoting factor, HPF/YfiA family n=1 Tax=Aminipila sp. TaxID=2060095 RepID=UPI001DE5E903|nr:ribosome-associated translation inhibitor RaiA [Aminipila sp.]MBE6033339.1 ribosome-associated translation inhibitor RaiA [Clostridiales bacterium]
MKIIITSKNLSSSDYLKGTIEKKLEKLSKYFSNDIVANVMVSAEKDKQKIEATINAGGTIFRAEESADIAYDAIDRVVDKLSSQMSRFKTKLQKKHKDNRGFMFGEIPDYESEPEEITIVKKKSMEIFPMNVEEAIMQMELIGHSFFVFMNMDSESVNVVYKRKNGDYGLIEAVY